jgi:hypothetical protein
MFFTVPELKIPRGFHSFVIINFEAQTKFMRTIPFYFQFVEPHIIRITNAHILRNIKLGNQ